MDLSAPKTGRISSQDLEKNTKTEVSLNFLGRFALLSMFIPKMLGMPGILPGIFQLFRGSDGIWSRSDKAIIPNWVYDEASRHDA